MEDLCPFSTTWNTNWKQKESKKFVGLWKNIFLGFLANLRQLAKRNAKKAKFPKTYLSLINLYSCFKDSTYLFALALCKIPIAKFCKIIVNYLLRVFLYVNYPPKFKIIKHFIKQKRHSLFNVYLMNRLGKNAYSWKPWKKQHEEKQKIKYNKDNKIHWKGSYWEKCLYKWTTGRICAKKIREKNYEIIAI